MDPNLECCVLGCHTRPNQGVRFYRFPCHNPQISSIWKQRICQSANIAIDILNNHVCELHFEYRCKTGNECALEEGSLPTLHLPSFGNLSSTGSAHFEMSADTIEHPSYTISVDTLSHHCRFCLRSGLLYDVEASTYRSKSCLSLIDLLPNVLPDNTQTNACLNCLKSIVIAHQLSRAVEHSNTIVQLLLQHPKQSKVLSFTNFFDMKSELAFCNLILANSFSIKLEIETENNIVCTNEDYERKWVATGEPTSSAAHMNSPNMVEKSISVTEIQDNVSQMLHSITSDKQCQKEFHKSSTRAFEENTIDLRAEEIPNANEISDSGVLMENTDGNAEDMFSNDSDYSCAEDRQLDNEVSPKSPNKAVNEATYKCDLCKFTTTYNANLDMHKNQHLAGNDTVHFYCQKCEKDFLLRRHFVRHNTLVHSDGFTCKVCDKPHASATKLAVHYTEYHHSQCDTSPTVLKRSGHRAHVLDHKQGKKLCNLCGKIVLSKHKCYRSNAVFSCARCLFSSKCLKRFKRHQHLHNPNVKRFLCNRCGRGFHQKISLAAHQKQHAKLENPPELCSNEVRTRNGDRQHIQKRQTTFSATDNENDGVYVCPTCDWKTVSPYSFNVHLGKHVQSDKNGTIGSQELETLKTVPVRTADGRYQCTECPKAFRNKSHFSEHRRMHRRKRPYKCTECSKAFSNNSDLSRHKTIHTNERLYKCNERPKPFRYKTGFSQQKRIHTNERPYKCTECPKTFNQKIVLNIHKRIHTNEKPYKCTECTKDYENKSHLRTHMRTHTDERRYKCTECSKTFSRKDSLVLHKRIHTKERPFKCTECSKDFRSKSGLRIHMRTHTDERPYKCTECSRSFSQLGNYYKHMKIHTNERPYKCTECSRTFSRKDTLDIHKRIHTNERPYKCTECPKTFSSKSHFNVHMRTHTDERPYKCTKCSRTFSQLSNFYTHTKVHTNEKPYKCTECSRTFSQKTHFSRHKRVHTKERPYKCTECPKTFSEKGNLITHKRIHTNENPYKCTECSKTFRDKGNLNRHNRIHTNDNPFKCTECPKTFKQNTNLIRHKSTHTNERPYKCTECPKTFRSMSGLYEHKKKHE